jgi:hypothetical protein
MFTSIGPPDIREVEERRLWFVRMARQWLWMLA